jgi:transcriptional regulator with XRE-family HTH domain
MTRVQIKQKFLEHHDYQGKAGFNQRSIAKLANLHPNTVNAYLHGQQIPEYQCSLNHLAALF